MAQRPAGYTFPDAWLFRDLLSRKDLTPENIEWIRRQLLKYEEQIRKLGFDYDFLNKIRISDRAIFWRKIRANANLVKITITIKKETHVVAVYRLSAQRKKEKVYANLSREQGIALLKKLPGLRDFWSGLPDDTSPITEMKIELDSTSLVFVARELGFPEV
jgi:hypothetical protein